MSDTNNLVNDLLNILQPDAETPEKKPKKEKTVKSEAEAKPKQEKTIVRETPKKTTNTEGFLAGIEETMKNTMIAKVVIRKDLYEVFMSIKRAKQVKSVSTLLDHALEDYIKRHADNIRQLLNESKKNTFI